MTVTLKPIALVRQSDEQFSCGTYKWIAECGCGKEFTVRKRNVQLGITKSCGCFRKMNTRARRLLESEVREPNWDTVSPTQFYRYNQSAIRRSLPFEISYELFDQLVNSPCHYCGRFVGKINGIDRMDNSVGYTDENCTSCCSTCNFLKGSMEYSVFVELIKVIYLNLSKYHE